MSFSPGIAVAGLARFAVLVGAYVFLAENGTIWWDSPIGAAAIAAGSEIIFMAKLFETKTGLSVGVGSLYRALVTWLDRWIAVRRYKDRRAALNVLASSNTLASLDQTVRFTLAELPNPEEHRMSERMLDLQLAQQVTADGRRKVLAQELLQRVPWSQLVESGLVPSWARDPDNITDPDVAVQNGVDFCELNAITADDLDRYIRRQLEPTHASLTPSYELMLAESQGETSERLRLNVRARFLVKMLGPQPVVQRLDEIAATIVAIKGAVPAPVPAAVMEPGREAPAPLKLLRAELQNIRCFRTLRLDFSEDGQARPWTMLLGDNGLGKTTILRSIAMALCDQTSATAFMKDLSGELLRQDTEIGSIHMELSAPDQPDQKIWVRTTLTRSRHGVELQQAYSDWFPRDRLFVCGYGALRSGFGTASPSRYAVADAVATLFKSDALLQNPELALRRMESSGENIDRICRQLESVLLLPENSTEFSASGIAIHGPWGQFVPAGAIGDGYLATLAWLSDLLGWAFFFRPGFLARDISGIVVIDEIEKHLHPRWQREIVRQLNRQFPNLQFLVSTHSPLCAGGLADLEEGQGAMYRLWMTGSGAVEGEDLAPFRGWTYDQIMTSIAFGLQSVRDVSTQHIMDELHEAHEAGDEEKVKQMHQALASRSVTAAKDERDRQLREKLIRTLEALQEDRGVAHRDSDQAP